MPLSSTTTSRDPSGQCTIADRVTGTASLGLVALPPGTATGALEATGGLVWAQARAVMAASQTKRWRQAARGQQDTWPS
jgi:hypothetical protein